MIKDSEKVAIIGSAFRLPGARREAEFWRRLVAGDDLVTEVETWRWPREHFFHPSKSEPGRAYTFASGVVEGTREFDAAFFGISPREATQMDPQQRMLMQLSWEALEDAGIKPSSLNGSDCGVFVGISTFDYSHRVAEDVAASDSKTPTGNAGSIAANRISYFYDLRGPSMVLDTACSSALVAFHQACMALRNGDSDAAIVGGVSLHYHPLAFITFCKAGMLSRTGRCRTFDAAADGYVRSEGGGVLVLKPLARARADGDRVLAVVEASGTNSDGSTRGITVPSGEAQAQLLERTYREAGVDPRCLDYLEAHGTGTAVGDPIEAHAIGHALARFRPPGQPLPIGSIKSNLGHLEAASGIAGLAKVLLAFKHRVVPPNLHFTAPNPRIDLGKLNLRIVTEPLALPADRAVLAGINSFGFGGSNAHVILSGPPPAAPAKVVRSGGPWPVVISAKTDESLRGLAGALAGQLAEADGGELYDVACALHHRRDRLTKRALFWADERGPQGLVAALRGFAAGDDDLASATAEALPQNPGPVYVFTGNGGQWLGMGRALFAESGVFREAVLEVDQFFRALAPFSLRPFFEHGQIDGGLDRTENAQPLIFAIQLGLVRLLESDGLAPAAVMGHSLGEVAAAWAAGFLDLATAVRVIRLRSVSQQPSHGRGGMTVVSWGREELEKLLASPALDGAGVSLSGENAAQSLTAAGPLEGLASLEAALAAQDVFFKRLDLPYAFHSSCMDEAAAAFLSDAGRIASGEAAIPFYSTVTGARSEGPLSEAYWAGNIRQPVRFRQAVASALCEGHRVFLEIGPHPVLTTHVQKAFAAVGLPGHAVAAMTRDEAGAARVQRVARQLILGGAGDDWRPCFPHPAGSNVEIPRYPWQPTEFFCDATAENSGHLVRGDEHPLLGRRARDEDYVWEKTLDPDVMPWLADHVVGGAVIFPAACFVEMALGAAVLWHPDQPPLVHGLEISAPLAFEARKARVVQFSLDSRTGAFVVSSRERLSHDSWQRHATGRIPTYAAQTAGGDIFLFPQDMTDDRDEHPIYEKAARVGLEYGPCFRPVRGVRTDERGLVARLELPSAARAARGGFVLDPILLDGALQSLLALPGGPASGPAPMAFVPVRFERIEVANAGVPPVLSRLVSVRPGKHSVLADFCLHAADGSRVARVLGVRLKAARLVRPQGESCVRLVEQWIPKERVGMDSVLRGRFTVVRDRLAARLDEEPADGLLKRYCREGEALLDTLCASFAWRALRRLANGDGRFDLMDCMASGAVAVEREMQARRLLEMLEKDGMVRRDDVLSDRWWFGTEAEVLSPEEIWNSLLAEFPEKWSRALDAGRAGEHLAEYLAGRSNEGVLDPPAGTAVSAVEAELLDLVAGWVADLGSAPDAAAFEVLWVCGAKPNAETTALALAASKPCTLTVLLSAGVHEDDASALAEGLQGVTVVQGSPGDVFAADAPLAGRSFDLVIAPPGVATGGIDILLRVLRPGGVLLSWRPEQTRLAELTAREGDSTFATACRIDQTLSLRARTEVLPILRDWPGVPALVLATREMDTAGQGSPGCILLMPMADASMPICDGVRSKGGEIAEMRVEALPPPHGEVAEIWGRILEEHSASRVVLLFPALGGASGAADRLDGALAALSSALLAVARWRPTTTVVVVTQGAHSADDGDDWQAAGLWGFARVARNELSPLRIRCIDLPSGQAGNSQATPLLEEILSNDPEDEIRLDESGRRVCRVMPPPSGLPSAESRATLDFDLPGSFRHLRWRSSPRREPGPGQLCISVRAAGLNFRDVMYAMGLLPDELLEGGYAGAGLGMEVAGVVTSVGPGVERFQPGDEVAAFTPEGFSSEVITSECAVLLKPRGVGFEAAASIPVAFFTAYHALHGLAGLREGERVLVHGAAGGVGVAAIQIARLAGAEIFATAGTPAKRDFVRLLGAHHVLDSRSLDFADAVRELTADEGVDVVLNSLAGEAMRRSLEALRPFGRFIELGKRDFHENSPIGLRPLRHNIRYLAFDADEMMAVRPEEVAQSFGGLAALLQSGDLSPLPVTVFAASDVAGAFRHMQRSAHVGKIVVDLRRQSPVGQEPEAYAEPRLRADGTYLVTGGLKGFGLATARRLVDWGAGALVLVTRSGAVDPDAHAFIGEARCRGVEVLTSACDVGDGVALARLLDRVRSELPPLRGVFHAAAVLRDALIANASSAQIHEVVAPKVEGARWLDSLTRQDELDHFVLYSSATALFGNPGQAAYVAANAALEALARRRIRAGLPALCIGWGPISDAGFVARHAEIRRILEARTGGEPVTSVAALDFLGRGMAGGKGGEAWLDFDWAVLSRFLPSSGATRFDSLRHLRKHGRGGHQPSADLRVELLRLNSEQLLATLKDILKDEIAGILRVDASTLDENRPLLAFGMDSLMGVELFTSLESSLGVSLPMMALSESPTIARLAARLREALEPQQPGEEPAADAAHQHAKQMLAQHGSSDFDEAQIAELAGAVVSSVGTTRPQARDGGVGA